MPKTFAQVQVSSFSYLSTLLADGSQSGIQIQIDTPTIVSVANYSGCGGTKYITGLPDISVLDGNGFFGIYGNYGGQELHLSSITLCNFYKTASPALGDQKNGATLFFQNGAKLYFDGNVNIISNTISDGGGDFQNSGGDGAGVCINNSELYASSVTMNFIANISSDASGAALYFNSSKVNFFNDKILFQDNGAGDEGGALWAWDNAQLYFINSSVTFLRNMADLSSGRATTNPNPVGVGGSISIKQKSASILFQGTTQVDFTSNSARNGGAIYTGGTINFECTSVVFSENVATSSGGAVYVTSGLLNLDSSNGDIIFTGNQSGAGDAAGHDIYLEAGTVIINGSSGRVVINDGIAGTELAKLNKVSNGLFLLGGSNQYFRGTFLQTGGTTTVIGNYFTGKSSITSNSVLEFSTGAVLEGGIISLWDEAVMNITTPNNLTFSGEITGTDGTNISKPSSGTLTLSGNNSGFKGTFLQSSGTTKIETGNGISTYFAGLSSITNGSILEIGNNGEFANEGEKIELWTNGGLRITKSNGNLNLNGQVEGDGRITKSGTTELVLTGDNSKFVGIYHQTNGTTSVAGTFFAGISTISTSNLEFNTGVQLVAGSTICIDASEGKLGITAQNLTIQGQVVGGGLIEKRDGRLLLQGNNSGFVGTFVQSSGTTLVTNDTKYFDGTSSITKSVLEWENAEFVGTIGLWEGGQLKLKNSSDIELSGQVEGIGTIEKDVNSVGDLLLKGNNSKFSGIFKLSAGNAIVDDGGGTQYFTGITSITTEGVLVLGQGAEVVGGCIELWNVSGDINTAGKLDITKTDESISFSTAAVLGKGVINKTGDTVLNIVGDCTGFTGTFFESQGQTVIRGNYFTGYSSITGRGDIELSRGGSLSGGVIGLWEGGSLYITNPTDMEFIGGTLEGNGYIEKSSSATLRLYGDHSIFKGVYHQSSGTTVSEGRYFSGTSSITGQSMLVMANESDLSGGGTIELWDQAVLEITTFGDLTFSGEITGTLGTKIIKTSTGTLTLIGDNSGFQGLYLQSSGRTLISGKYFIGYSSITDASILELGNVSDLSGGGTIGLWENGVMNIKTGKDLEITGNIEGDAFINKTSSCTLSLSGDNSGFVGMFIQSSGTTIVNGNYFSGISSIGSSVLELTNGSDITKSRAIYLNRNGILSITSDDLTSFVANQVYGTMANGAVIEKSGLGELKITGDNGTFGGLFLQSNGTTTVSANYFGETSVSSITGGILDFVDGSSSSIIGRLQLWQDGVFKISKSGDLNIGEDIISGNGEIFKVGGDTFTIAGVNRDFVGTFRQSSGTTIVLNSDYMFGTNIIENSLLKVTMSDICENRKIDYSVFLSTGGILEHESAVNDDLRRRLQEK
ncbi:MAG: hypothetical protein LBH33_00915 [Endomicrobium sp.]|nr:hypothetical protein [Endomicrobium sp.]